MHMRGMIDILAIGGDAIEAIVMVVVMVIAGLSGLLKKKAKPGESAGKTIIIPPPDSKESGEASARPAPPSARPVQAPRPQRTAASPVVRPTPIAPQARQPQARPTPVARQRPPQARPTPILHPAQPRRPASQPAPQQRPVRRPAQTAQSERQGHRVRASEHAEAVAEHAEHVASRLKEKQMRKAGKLELGEHAHEDQSVPARPRHPLLASLNPQNMREAILLSEIIQPPLALRNEQGSGSI